MMKRFIMGICLLFPLIIHAGIIEHEIYIDASTIKIEMLNDYHYISIHNFGHLTEPGLPALPATFLSFVIPSHANFEHVEVIREQGVLLQGSYTIFPAQKPVPISASSTGEFTRPDMNIYSQQMLYPAAVVQYAHEGNLSGYQIVSVLVTPLRYNPVARSLYLTQYLKFRIHYRDGAASMKCISELQKELAEQRVKALVENKNQVESFAPTSTRGLWQSEYVIITDASFVDAFRPLKEWKMRRGVPTEIVTTSWIYANYSGVDNATKIRNFVDAAADSGAVYFLLAGQGDWEHSEEYVPRRDVYCMTSGVGNYTDEDTIPCDLYYADLDGTWDANSNSTYGEMGDGVNLYSDVYVGRAPVKHTAHVNNFVSKIITYEKCPALSFTKKVLLPVGNLWPVNHGNGINDTIAYAVPSGWQKSKLYEDYGLMSRYIVRDSINSGYNLCHMVGHGNQYGIYYNYGVSAFYYYSDPNTQTNDSTDAVISNSIGCYCGALDQGSGASNNDCMAERMVNSNKQCATATMMNSRYGWGYASIPNSLGPSGELSVWFYRKLFSTNAYHLGQVFAASKDQLAPHASWDTYWRWTVYESILFGDPEMPIWTDVLKNLIVNFSSDTIAVFGDGKADTFTVTVQYMSSPVANALVTIMQDSSVYERQFTNGSGQAQFIFADSRFQNEGYVWVTATKYSDNFVPNLDSGVVVQTLNVDESPPRSYASLNVVFSPNPAVNSMKVDLGAPLVHDCTLSFYDIRGSLVKSMKLNSGVREVLIATSELSSGVYFLKSDSGILPEEKIIVVR
ncbi:MAG: T9SS type A sorting domain-containing protein [candidate division WOR-3 bacterium]|nr:MAG: T9SS type A sorting domain-containing protein [candidate division WOR-3 bacterium]